MKNESLRIRLFERSDTDALVKIAADYAAFHRAMPKDWLISTYEKHPQSVWVAEVNNELAGFIIGYETETPRGTSRGNIELMAVHPNHRKKGIGKKLLEAILKQFKKANLEEVYLFCPATAVEAKRLYEKLGFKVDAYYMKRKL